MKAVTIEALLVPATLARIGRVDGWRFCPSPACETAYFHSESGERVAKFDVRVRIGVKEAAAPRPVCYCFGHTIEEIEGEVARTGASSIAAAITDQCRQGLDRCAETNPQGSCCLGNVRAAEKAALAGAASSPADEAVAGCCPAPDPLPAPSDQDSCGSRDIAPAPPRGAASHGGLLSSAGAVASAILASACCWLPLVLVAFGASAASVSGFFEQYRLAFLAGAGALLGLGFYFVYFRQEDCGPDGACVAPSRRLQRFNRTVLWVATALVVVTGAFPRYVGAFLSRGPEPAATPAGAAQASFAVSGMTCEACAITIRSELEALPGVAHADVSFERKTATVVAAEGSPLPSDDAMIGAVRRAGSVAERSP